MSHWNYRVMKRRNGLGGYEYGIYEVYYDDNGNIEGWTEDPMTPTGSSEDDLRDELEIMKAALNNETLIYKED